MIGTKIKQLRDKQGLTQEQLAYQIDVSRNTVLNWEKGKREPRASDLSKLAAFFEVSIDSLIIDNGKNQIPPQSDNIDTSPGEPPVWIDVVEPVVCAGKGNDYYEISWEPVERYPFSASDLIGYAWHSGKMRIIRIEGSSMEPRYRDGDRVMFSEEEVTSGDVAIVLWDGKLLIRGYVIERGKTVHLRALNKENPEIVVYPEDERFQVLGKVLGRVSRFEPDKGFW